MTDVDLPATPQVDIPSGVARWSAIGTYVHLAVARRELIAPAAARAVEILELVDQTYSRFRPDSELVRLGEAGGRHTVTPLLAGALRVALEAARETDGLVDPTLAAVLSGAGYDRTFADLPRAGADPVALPVSRPPWQEIRLGEDWVELPAGARLDLGATGKGFAADLIADTLADELDTDVLVSLGGDVRCCPAGVGAGGTRWPVQVAPHPDDLAAGRVLATLLVDHAGVATSSTTVRRWQRGGEEWHHVLDPRTGRPSRGPWTSVTVVENTCTAANTASTAALVHGASALDWLLGHDVAAFLVPQQGPPVRTPAWLSHVDETTGAIA